ncbi:MAG: DNA replication/repair protein RecF [Pseudomonadota bacterium]
MQLLSLITKNFRNLVGARMVPCPRFNVLHGDNAQGKTNTLEAIYLMATLRSFRARRLTELIRHDASMAEVSAEVHRRGLSQRYDVVVNQGSKQTFVDGKATPSLGQYFAGLNVVLFAPEDLHIVRGAPALRRRLLDRAVFNSDPTYLGHAQTFLRVLRTRNALLRRKLAPPNELLAVYDEQFVREANRVKKARQGYLTAFEPIIRDTFSQVTAGSRLTIAYRTNSGNAEDLAEALANSRPRDLERHSTTVGPHLDDFDLLVDGTPARTFASQGQIRALVLAWKVAEVRFLLQYSGESPLLLLDDVCSELDASRTQWLFSFLRSLECQCFVTATDPKMVPHLEHRLDFQVVAGNARPVEATKTALPEALSVLNNCNSPDD